MRLIRLSITLGLIPALMCCSNSVQKKGNRLKDASSPYLRDHADNPVDWYQWGEEALARAKKENKPLLISIGYASCHWCHQMEQESFMDTAVARIMNENFICIKVDREERPDIDGIYMNALQLITSNTGWPLNAFALPDGKPFFAGTYYSKASWTSLLLNISKAYSANQKLVATQAGALVNGMSEEEFSFIDTVNLSTERIQRETYNKLFDSIYKWSDQVNGGLKGAPKFPMPSLVDFLLQHYYTSGNNQSLVAATTTLKKMALGGIYDQIAGGFSRYSIDSTWHIPHFEKMLYDNGLLVSTYAHAYQLTKDNFYKKIVEETLSFIDKNLRAPAGGYYCSLNADTETGEGEYYSWTKKDFSTITGNDIMLSNYFHVSEEGNWKTANNILYANQTAEQFSKDNNLPFDKFNTALNAAKANLLKERNKRQQPSVDAKILTGWNGIVVKALADGYAATGNEDYFTRAVSCASFLEKNRIAKGGKLRRSYNDKGTSIDGFLDDYAWTAAAFIKLYEVSFDKHWLQLSKTITDYAIENFLNKKTGLFYYTEGQQELVIRKTEIADNIIPSSNAVMAKVLYKLGTIYADSVYTVMGVQMYNSVAERVKKLARFHTEWCSVAGLLSAKPYEIVIMGKEAIEKNKILQQSFLPTSTIMGSMVKDSFQLLKDKFVSGKTIIYVCTDKICKRPEEDPVKAKTQIVQ
ncbi:thioredoxin domain-containing protein [Ferruginibacter sp.]